MDNIEIARRLKQLRTENRLSQRQFAEILGIKQPAYHRIEVGDNALSIQYAITLYREFGISFNWLILGVGEQDESDEPELVRLAWELERNDPVMKFQVISKIYELKAEKEGRNRKTLK